MWIPRRTASSDLEMRLDRAQQDYVRLTDEINDLMAQLSSLRHEDVASTNGEITARFNRDGKSGVEGQFGAGLPPGQATRGPLLPPPPMPVPTAALQSVPEQYAAFDAGLVNQLTTEELNNLPYGVIVVDGQGKILHYNDTESRLVGLPREAVLGRHFFGDVAPCARVREFEGRFRTLVAGQSRLGIETFEFVFHFAKGAQRVLIMLSPGRLRGQYNISLLRR